MMVDLSPASRLTRKRNMLLQKQLGVRLQIIADEYRMTKKDLEKNSRDLGMFLMYLRDRAPGLSSYGQPDTRAMNAKNILRDREMGTARKKDDDNDAISVASKTTKNSQKDPSSLSTANSQDDETGDRSKSPSARSSKHEFFNKRIVLDSKRRNFLQQCMNKDQGKYQDSRQLGGAATHTGFLSNRDTAGEASTKPRPQTAALLSERSKIRYGSDAYSDKEESIRQHVLGRFDVIFDPESIKKVRNRKGATPSSTPLYLPIPLSIPEDSESLVTASRPPPVPSGYVLNRRVAWSAPPKRREAPSTSGAGDRDARTVAASRQNLSVTPRSGTANLTNTTYRRSKSATCKRAATSMREEREVDANAMTNQDLQSQRRDPNRPKTAPQVYQLMQKSVAAPRQQVAGILAEIQSRRADTRAMLLKSKQLKKMVKSLAPEEKDEDSYSD